MKKIFTLDNLTSAFFYLSILLFLIGFNFTDSPLPFGWYQQFMPNLNGRNISDVFFLDSLNGWAITPYVAQNDTFYVLRTTNAGDNWSFQYALTGQFVGNNKIYFMNQNTGYTCGTSSYTNSISSLRKTTNGGFNWFNITAPDPFFSVDDIDVLNEDTFWIAVSSSASGGVYLTTNGGQNWTRQIDLGASNPDKIYMFNRNIGFISKSAYNTAFYNTLNGGLTWNLITNNDSFYDMYFIDSLTGWKARGFMKKTTDGGLNWVTQILPSGGQILITSMLKFSNVNKDTIWGVGGDLFLSGNRYRGIIYKTINGGTNWGFQIPDTSIDFDIYYYSKFTNKLNGWAYILNAEGVHTLTGGDTITYSSIRRITSKVPDDFVLEQNYPNPFNISTKFKVQISKPANIRVAVFDVTGRLTAAIFNQRLNAGAYEVSFDGSKYSSGVYFYSLFVDGNLISTRKMLLLK
jgi:photosystem II stability/assembly factor-like uncharacterized protein